MPFVQYWECAIHPMLKQKTNFLQEYPLHLCRQKGRRGRIRHAGQQRIEAGLFRANSN